MGAHTPLKRAWQRTSVRVSLALLPVALGTAAVVAPSGAAPSRSGSIALAARTLNLNVNANLHLVGRPGHTLTEQGSFTGTLSGTVSSRSVAISTSHGTGTFTMSTKHGSFSGQGISHSRIVGATAYFSGTAKIVGGTGEWAHALGSVLAFSGTVDRQNYQFNEHITGSLRY